MGTLLDSAGPDELNGGRGGQDRLAAGAGDVLLNKSDVISDEASSGNQLNGGSGDD